MKVGIIGCGAAGLMAAAFCKGEVTVIERNEKAGKKLYITGKGRCNLTNNRALYEFFPNIIHGDKFMISTLTAFPPPVPAAWAGSAVRMQHSRIHTVREDANSLFFMALSS